MKQSIAQWVKQRTILTSLSETWNELNIDSILNWFQKWSFSEKIIKNIKFLKFLMWLKRKVAVRKKLNSAFNQDIMMTWRKNKFHNWWASFKIIMWKKFFRNLNHTRFKMRYFFLIFWQQSFWVFSCQLFWAESSCH